VRARAREKGARPGEGEKLGCGQRPVPRGFLFLFLFSFLKPFPKRILNINK